MASGGGSVARLFVQPDDVAAGVAEAGGELAGVGTNALHDLAALSTDAVDRDVDRTTQM